MNRRRNVLSPLHLLLVVFLLLSYVQVAPAHAQDGAAKVFVPFVSTQAQGADQTATLTAGAVEAAEVAAYWTPEQRAAAKPYVPQGMGPLPAPAEAGLEAAIAIPGASPAGRAAPGSQAVAQAEFPDAWAAMAAGEGDQAVEPAAVDGGAGIYTTYRGNYYTPLWQYFPYRAVGKLYFKTWSGGNAYCSASVISPNNILVTAAHCVYDTDYNRWQGSWLFVPAERNLAQPYGSFGWSSARVLVNWMNAANYNAGIRYDVSLIRLRTNSAGRTVTYYTGYLGRAWNWGYVQNLTEIGYPSNLTTLYTSISHFETYYYSPDVLAYGSNMGAGASGSPLLLKFAPYVAGAVNYVDAVQSGSNNVSSPTLNVAPRFSSNNIVPLCTAEGC